MNGLIVRGLAVFVAVIVAAALFPERVYYRDWQTAAIFAAVLALINTFIRPIMHFFTWPLTCLTFGLFAIIVNGLTFWLAAQVVRGVGVGSFLDAVLAALVVSGVSFVVSRLF